MNRSYHKWWSPHLRREMELLVFGHGGARVLVFPTRGGRFYEYENLRLVERLAPKLDAGTMQLFCIDELHYESFYCFWAHPSGRVKRYLEFEHYVLQEVFPFMDSINTHPCTISHGCSLGAFHAANLAFRHPHLFQKLCAFSGRYDLTLAVESFNDLFDGFYNDDVYFNTPSHFLPNLQREDSLSQLRSMDIVLVVGKSDPFLYNNLQLSRILSSKGVNHSLHLWDGRAHSGYYWRRMVEVYL